MWNAVSDPPRAGKRVIAPYNDGSGACMFMVLDDGQGGVVLLDTDGEEYPADYLVQNFESFSEWAYLPDGFKLWCEVRSDDPVMALTGEQPL